MMPKEGQPQVLQRTSKHNAAKLLPYAAVPNGCFPLPVNPGPERLPNGKSFVANNNSVKNA